ncbi:unnamed protein product, partial [marine sediment metagenome]
HLEMPPFDDDRDEVIRRAAAGGVAAMITVATTLSDARKAAGIVRRHPAVRLALGIHPHEAASASLKVYDQLVEIAGEAGAVAWGEIGLDFYYDNSPRQVQRRVFAEQIHIARRLGLPLIIHTRKAPAQTLEILRAEMDGPYRGVVHCYGGDIETASALLDLGFVLGFTGVITFKNAMREHAVIRHVGPDHILVETDCPYLAPRPHRGKRNEPAYTRFVAEKVAEVLDLPYETVERKTRENTLATFPALPGLTGIDPP